MPDLPLGSEPAIVFTMGRKGNTASTGGRTDRPIVGTSHPSTFGSIADRFLTSQKGKLSSASLLRLESMIKRFSAFFQDTTIFATISESQIREFIRQRASESAPGSLRLELGALKRMFRMAFDSQLIATNPASKISVPREKVVTRYLSPDDFRRVHDASPEWLKAVVDFTVGTALTRQELLRARWEDVIQANGEMLLRVSQGKSERKVPLNELSKRALRSSRQRNPARGLIFRGKSVTSTNISQAFMRACRSAGVDGVSFKDLRHTSALWMKQEGVPLETIAQVLGYVNAQTAVRYIQNQNTKLDKAVETLDRAAKRRFSGTRR
jgi:integrase